MRINLLHAHGSPTNYQYNHHGCRCVACRCAKSAYHEACYPDHREELLAYQDAYRQLHKEELRAYEAARYQDHREEDRQKSAEFTEWLQILRAVNGCADCETHEGLLDHHHVDPATKRYDVSEMATCSLDSIEDELEKCVVLCRSGHKLRHAEMRAA